MHDLRYPVGRFDPSAEVPRADLIDSIEAAPARLRAAVAGLTDEQLETPYREGGWTVRQVVHHIPDSHINSYIRFRWALTEDNPLIKAYDEALWANIYDAANAPIDVSLNLLDAVHARWIILLRSLSEADFQTKLTHPQNGEVTLGWMLRLYEWHGRHHVAHITGLRERMAWI